MSSREENTSRPGVSLARGPALILGAVLLVAGLYFLYKLHTFPKLSQFPSGKAPVEGKAFLGIFGVNGWSGELTAAAGGLLLFGAAQHFAAKAMSLIVGIALAVVAIIALVHHHSALGLFAANIWTIILWGGSAVLLLVNTLLPRASARDGGYETAEPRRTSTPVVATPPGARTTAPVAPAAPAPTTAPATAAPATPAQASTTPADSSTIIPERPAVRVRPSGSSGSAGSSGASGPGEDGRPA